MKLGLITLLLLSTTANAGLDEYEGKKCPQTYNGGDGATCAIVDGKHHCHISKPLNRVGLWTMCPIRKLSGKSCYVTYGSEGTFYQSICK